MYRLLRTLSVCFLLVAACAIGQSHAWEIIMRDNVKYVTMMEVRAFGFSSQRKEGNSWIYEGATKDQVEKVKMKLRSGSQDMSVNGLKFVLSYPAIEDPVKGMLVSVMDVVKIIHPIMMPKAIETSKQVETVVIDAGHGGHDSGATNRGMREKDLNLAAAKKLKALLTQKGFKVVMTRETDVYLTLQQRVAIANRYQNAVFVSIHFNSSRPSASGLETYTLAPAGTSSAMSPVVRRSPMEGNSHDCANIALATAVQGRMLTYAPQMMSSKLDDRGIKRARFSVLCTIKHPAILVECGFLSNPREAQLIANSKYLDYVASAIADGVGGYRGALSRLNRASNAARVNVQASAARLRHDRMR